MRRLTIGRDFTANGRRVTEVEFAVIEIRHARQALTQGIQANDVGIHLSDATRQRVDLLLQHPLGVFDLDFLTQQFGGPVAQLINGIDAPMS